MPDQLASRPALEAASTGFSPTSTANERIKAFLEAGLSPGDLRRVVDVSEATIRNWSDEKSSPREQAARVLDDLRATMIALHEAGVTGDRAVSWLTSRNFSRWLSGERPIEMLRSDPLAVLATIEEMLDLARPADGRGQALHLHARRKRASASKSLARDARKTVEHETREKPARLRAELNCADT